jgi:hypothetical protein
MRYNYAELGRLLERIFAFDEFCQDPADSSFPFGFEKTHLHAGALILQNLNGSFLIGCERITIPSENANFEAYRSFKRVFCLFLLGNGCIRSSGL